MTVFSMTVVQVAPKSAMSKAGKPYRLVELAYTNHSWQDKIESAKINEYSKVFKQVAEMQQGQSYTVTKEKDASGYYQWTDIVAGMAVPASSPSPSPVAAKPAAGPASTGTPVRSTYETPEERAKKQVLIVKQSSIAQAVALHAVGAKTAPSLDTVLTTAQALTDWVFDEKPITLGNMVNMPNDLDMQVD